MDTNHRTLPPPPTRPLRPLLPSGFRIPSLHPEPEDLLPPPMPQPVAEDLDEKGCLPLGGLPTTLRVYADSTARMLGCHRDYALGPVLAAVGAAAGNRVSVTVGPYTNRLNIFLVTVGRPGANKSAPSRRVLEPLSQHNARLYADYRAEMGAWRDGDKKGTPPPKRAFMLADVTVERLCRSLGDNPGGLLLHRDEAGAFLQSLAKYSGGGGGEYRLLNEIYDGNQLRIDRQGDDMVVVDNPVLSFMGTTQPRCLKDVFGKSEIVDSGFLQRFAFVYPESLPPYTGAVYEMPPTVDIAWSELLRKVLSLPAPVRYDIRGEALETYETFRAASRSFQSDDQEGYEAMVWSKLEILAVKLAGIAHLAAQAEDGTPTGGDISPVAMKWGVKAALYFRQSQLRIRQEMGALRVPPRRELLQMVLKAFDVTSQADLARVLGVGVATVSRAANQQPCG